MAGMETIFRTWQRLNRGTRGKAIVLFAVLLLCVVLLFSCRQPSPALTKTAEISDNFKTEYVIGEALSPQGTLTIKMGDELSEEIPITEDMITGFDSSRAGEFVVTVRYKDYSATALIHVSAVTATSIEVDAETLPSVIYERAAFPSTVTFTAHMSDGTVQEHVPVAAYMLGSFNSTVIGVQTVSLSYLGASTVLRVTVKKDVRKAITLVGARARYGVGDALDVSGARLDVLYESGKVSGATLTENLVSGFHTDKGGNFVAKITYNDLECDYPYEVVKAAASLSLIKSTFPDELEKGAAFPAGAKATVIYDDGTTKEVAPTAADAPTFDVATAGEKSVLITVEGVQAEYRYTVLRSIKSALPSGYTSAVACGAVFDGLGEFLVEYEDGDRETINFTDTERLTIRYDTSKVGDVEQTVVYCGREYPFTVHVYDESEENDVDHIEIAGVFPMIKQGDPINVSGLQVYIVYKYLEPTRVDLREEWVEATLPEDPIETDYVEIPVTIRCFGVSYENMTVRVLSTAYAEKVTSVTPYGFRALYCVGETFDPENAALSVLYGGGYAADYSVPVLESYVTEFDTSVKAENKEMTVTFGDYAVKVAYRVIDEEEAATVTALDVSGFAPLLFVGDGLPEVSVDGATVSAIYGYGYRVDRVPMTAEMLSGGPFTEAGTAVIRLSYLGATKDIAVTVHPVADKTRVTGISVPETIVTYVGTTPDLSLYMLKLTYGYGYSSDKIPLDSDGVTISSYARTTVGTVAVTVTYQGLTCSAFVTFIAGDGENVLQSVVLAQESKDEFKVGDELSDVSLVARYQNGRYERITVTRQMAAAFSTETAGSYEITISYGGLPVLYRYTVKE